MKATKLPIVLALTATIAPAHAALTISKGPTSDVACASNVCQTTAKDAVLNVKDAQALLAAGPLTIQYIEGDIVFAAEMSWASSSSLTVNAARSIIFEKPVTAEGLAAVTLVSNYNTRRNRGDVYFTDPGRLSFWDVNSKVTVDGVSYTLENSLPALAAAVAAQPGSYALSANYDASADGPYAGSPIPGAFGGKLEGLGHKITNLSIAIPSRYKSKHPYVGLFELLRRHAVLRDIGVVDVQITAASPDPDAAALSVGALAGGMEGGSLVRNSSATGTIHVAGQDGAGGLVGDGDIIENSYAAVAVTADGGVAGGLVGDLGGRIAGSHATGSVTGLGAGGLVGFGDGEITDCYATGTVSGGASTVDGGLVGQSDSITIDASFATGDVHGSGATLGGLLGAGFARVTNSYARGALVDATPAFAGGLMGNSGQPLASVYATGAVPPGASSGGVVGADTSGQATIAAYWNLDTSGISNPSQGAGNIPNDPGFTGLTTAQLQSGLPAGFDPKVWRQSPGINDGFPYLLANPPPR
jgi:hypothetical protein